MLQLDNFRRLKGYGYKNFKKMSSWGQDKGHGPSNWRMHDHAKAQSMNENEIAKEIVDGGNFAPWRLCVNTKISIGPGFPTFLQATSRGFGSSEGSPRRKR